MTPIGYSKNKNMKNIKKDIIFNANKNSLLDQYFFNKLLLNILKKFLIFSHIK